MKETKYYKDKKTYPKYKLILGLIINILLILSIYYLIVASNESNESIVEAAIDPDEILDPNDYTSLPYPTDSAAATEANTQLGQMQYGGILTIDTTSEDYCFELIRSYELGDIIYWELSDDMCEISIDANTGEIFFYNRYDWYDGDLEENDALTLAIQVANQFATLPDDKSSPEIYLEDSFSWQGFNPETGVLSESEDWNYWTIEYDRVKDNIITEDHMFISLNLNGYLSCYFKKWNMDLDTLSTTYSINQTQAESTAINYLGNGTVKKADKGIVRPNYYWPVPESPLDEEGNKTIAFGEDPVIAWCIGIKDDDDLCIIHVHGITNKIIGGEVVPEWYEEE